ITIRSGDPAIDTHTAGEEIRRARGAALDRAVIDAHERTWVVLADLDPAQWNVPCHPGVNPPRWEFGHVAWFAEYWVLREGHWTEDDAPVTRRPSMLPGADDWFDSSRVAHETRWTLELPPLDELRDYARAVLQGVRERIASDRDGDVYPIRLALFHEDMHAEALTYMRQTLYYHKPRARAMTLPAMPHANEDVTLPAGTFVCGSPEDEAFVFDNEKWAHGVKLPVTRIARRCVSNAEFAAFVAADGYRDMRWWSPEGRQWLAGTHAMHPARWRHEEAAWQQRWFGQWQDLPLDAPACHVSAFEAEAYCRWAGRRLPSEAEWERAAVCNAIDWGDAVWEWTADAFAPYPGFTVDRYRDYSRPWFHTHRSVRGGSFATPARMHHPRYRNFYLPHRNDIFIGFRTCALG